MLVLTLNDFSMKVLFVSSFLVVFSILTAFGQAGGNTLSNQFNGLKSKSSSYQENQVVYKVVRLSSLDAFYKSVQDTIRAREQALLLARKGIDQELVQARENLKKQETELEALKEENALKEQEVQKSASEIANLSVFGLEINKQTYVILSWGIILTLLVVFGVVMFLYKNSKVVTDEKKKAFEDIDQEFKEHKQNARDRELKIKRELQTEMNRVEELNQQIALLRKQAQV
jgi:hypothetical protein